MIVGISGHKQSGKNTVALIWQLLAFCHTTRYRELVQSKYITDSDYVMACLKGEEDYKSYSHYFSWEQKSFAYKLKKVVCALTGCTMENLEEDSFKNSYVPYTWTKSALDISTYRELLQKLGTDVFRRNIHENIWIDLLFEEWDSAQDSAIPNWLITDVRFREEANAVNERNGTLIRITSDKKSEDLHISERDLEDYAYFQYYIDNSGTLRDLIDQVINIMYKENVI